jgi:hypothetical protein
MSRSKVTSPVLTNYPLAVAQIDHTPMDVIVVDEEHRQPIQRPSPTVVIDVFSRMVMGFAIYLEKPSAFSAEIATAHAVLPKEDWLACAGVQAEWPCWGKMRTIHCDNAKEFRGTVIGRSFRGRQVSLLSEVSCPSDLRSGPQPDYLQRIQPAPRFLVRAERVRPLRLHLAFSPFSLRPGRYQILVLRVVSTRAAVVPVDDYLSKGNGAEHRSIRNLSQLSGLPAAGPGRPGDMPSIDCRAIKWKPAREGLIRHWHQAAGVELIKL